MKFRLLGLGLVATTALAACQPQETAAPEPALSIERASALRQLDLNLAPVLAESVVA